MFPHPRQRLRFVASPVEFIPPDRVVPGLLVPGLVETILSRGVGYMWGDYIVRAPPIWVMLWRPRTGTAGQAAILCVRQLGSQALLFAPQRVTVSQRSQCIAIIQYTACRVGSLPPLHWVKQ